MHMRFKKAVSPFLLAWASRVLRDPGRAASSRDRVWRLVQRHATFFNVSRTVTIANGMTMRVSSDPRVEQEILLFGEWEPLFTRYLLSLSPDDGIFLDVGANIGYFSLVAAGIFREVHAIEASPLTVRRFEQNIAANGLRHVTVHPWAVGAQEGHIDFYRRPGWTGGLTVANDLVNTLEARVPMAPLERILHGIAWHRVRFVKIDVDGLEGPVLDSLHALRDDLHPRVEIFVEYDPALPGTWPRIERFLRSGFSACLMQGPYDRQDYLDRNQRTDLRPIDAPPSEFCDLLLRRTSVAESRAAA